MQAEDLVAKLEANWVNVPYSIIPDLKHMRNIGILNGKYQSFKITNDLDFIYANMKPIFTTSNDWDTAVNVVEPMLTALFGSDFSSAPRPRGSND